MARDDADRPDALSAVTAEISDLVLTRRYGWPWLLGFAAAFGLLMVFCGAIAYLLAVGVGIWGVNIPVAWGFAITNFVWWIGIGHAGTLISAILLLLHQTWRNAINRFAEAMTLFAVACAGLMPLLHLGRPWVFYWMLPYPNTMNLWPQWRSALVWDIFAILTYALVSLIFWFIGMLPDLATLRDRATTRRQQVIYGVLAMGWRGSADHWARFRTAYLLLAGLATPLVVSVHSIVSLDFATTLVPGWHSTIFPPYFVAGAIYSGMAMVLTLAIPLRRAFHLQNLITDRHLDLMARLMLAAGWVVVYGYAMEGFGSWYSGSTYERFMMANRAVGPYAPVFWAMLACNVVVLQTLWFRWVRQHHLVLFLVSLAINTGMWLERYIIVVTSLHRDFLPAAWGIFRPTVWDVAILVGSFGLFFTCFLLFARFLPVVPMSEQRELIAGAGAPE